MPGFEGPILKGMNPFDNNEPRLTASERIRNKRDATIYQAEKQRFQNKKTCGNKNVKYYENGTIRSMKSYKLQKSLARGNVLCEDCDDKGLLCGGVANHDALASIRMGNNIVSEYWGGSGLVWGSGDLKFTQTPGFSVIQSDVSGVWGLASSPEISKADLSGGTMLPGSDPSLNMPFGYINNLINIPRNLDGSSVVIDPSNQLFPDELCDPFRYLKHTNLSTYVVARMLVPIHIDGVNQVAGVPSTCNDVSYNTLVGAFVRADGGGPLSPFGGGNIFAGVIDKLCCVGEVTILQDVIFSYATIPAGKYGLFDVYIKLFNISNYNYLSALLSIKATGSAGNWGWGPFSAFDMAFQARQQLYGAEIPVIESFSIIQGTIPPTHNQTKYNATKQSYMSCLENGTRKINFTKNTVKQNAYYREEILPAQGLTYAPDANFRSAVKATYPTVEELYGEYFKTSTINTISSLNVSNYNISDLTGIGGFTALLTLYCYNNQLTTLDLSVNTALTYLRCGSNPLNSLDVTQNTALTRLWCYNNQLTSLDVSANTALTDLRCYSNNLTSLDVSANTLLTDLNCGSNQLTSLDVTQNTALKELYCNDNSLNSLDVSANTALTILSCYDNLLTTLDVSDISGLNNLTCYDNSLNALDVSANTLLTVLNCGYNQLTSLDVSVNTALTTLYCPYNNISGGGTSYINTSWTSSFAGTLSAFAQNVAVSGDFCKVADASAVAYFTTNYPPGTKIPTGTNYFYTGVIADMPANRGQSPAVAGYNNKLYVFGGKYGSTPGYSTYDTFVVYDTITNSWSSPTPTMGEGRAWVYGAIWQDKVYIYSGTDDQSAASHLSMEIYDITNNSFSTVATPDKRTNYAAGAINGKIYICGGYMLGTGNTDSLIEYDISTGNFTTKTAMPVARVQHAAAVYNNKLYVMGGNGTNNSLIVYDPALNTWASLAAMSAGRYSLKAVTLGSYIYAVGGSDGGLKNTVFRYDPAGDTWSTELPMGEARASFGLGVANNAMFAVGNWTGWTAGGERIL